MRKSVLALATAGAVLAGVLAGATPATAHDHKAWVWSSSSIFAYTAGFTQVYSTHTSGRVCDDDDDGVGVYGRFKLDNGQIFDVRDEDGYGPNCGQYTAPSGRFIRQIEAVWRGGRTSGWQDA